MLRNSLRHCLKDTLLTVLLRESFCDWKDSLSLGIVQLKKVRQTLHPLQNQTLDVSMGFLSLFQREVIPTGIKWSFDNCNRQICRELKWRTVKRQTKQHSLTDGQKHSAADGCWKTPRGCRKALPSDMLDINKLMWRLHEMSTDFSSNNYILPRIHRRRESCYQIVSEIPQRSFSRMSIYNEHETVSSWKRIKNQTPQPSIHPFLPN